MNRAAPFLKQVRENRVDLEAAKKAEDEARDLVSAAEKRRAEAAAHRQDVEYQIGMCRNSALVAILTPDVVDVLAPYHRPGKCTDGGLGNDNGPCARCTLLQALKSGNLDGRWTFSTDPKP